VRLLFISALLAAFGLSSCGAIAPEAPDTIVEEVPIPEQQESSINIPIKIDLRPYLAMTDKALPKTFKDNFEQCDGVSFYYKFDRNPIEFKGNGTELNFEVDGKYLLKLNYCPECTSLFNDKGNCIIPRVYASCGVGEPMRKVTVGYSSTFSITPEFKFKSNTTLKKFETPDACEITVFKYDATSLLRKEVTKVLKDLEDDIDKQIAAIDIRTSIHDAWKSLSAPLSMNGYGYLLLTPTNISLGKVRFDGKEAMIDLHLTAKPKVVSAVPSNNQATALPKLSTHKNSEGFDISLDIVSDYDSLSAIFTREIQGHKVMIKENEVIFDHVKVHGANKNQLNIEVAFSGKKKGILYLTGTPVFDVEKQIISFPDLQFDLRTKSALLKSAKWLFSDKITELLRASSTFDLKPQLAEMKKMLENELNTEISQGVKLKASVQSLKLSAIYPSSKTLILRVNSTGVLKLFM
jgi:hypothetical protein